MKKFNLLIAALLITAMAYNNINAAYQKVPLLERFTNANCGPCVVYNQNGYTDWTTNNQDKVTIIHYHSWWPAGPEPIYNYNQELPGRSGQPGGRINFYGDISGVPYVKAEGTEINESGNPTNSALTTWLNTEIAKTVPLKVEPKFTLNGTTATIEVEVTSDVAYSNLSLKTLILEQLVQYTTAPGGNGETQFPFVARHSFPTEDMAGETFSIAAGETKTFSYTKDIPSTLVLNALYAVAFVEQGKGQIINSGKSKIILIPALEITQTQLYTKVKNGDPVKHIANFKNTNNFAITLELGLETDWDVTSNPTTTLTLQPGEVIAETLDVVNNTGKPSCNVVLYSIKAAVTTPPTHPDTGAIETSYSTIFIDVTSDVKYVATWATSNYDRVNAPLWAAVPYFNAELVQVPNIGWELTETDVLDDVEFVTFAMTELDPLNLVASGYKFLTKIKSLMDAGTKVVIENDLVLAWTNSYLQSSPSVATPIIDFFKNNFGVSSNGSYLPMINQQGDLLGLPLNPKDQDEDATNSISDGHNLTVNSGYNSGNPYYTNEIDLLKVDANIAKASYVSEINTSQTTTDTFSFLVKSGDNVSSTRRVLISFETATLPVVDRNTLYASIVDYLMFQTGIEETQPNLWTNNGMKLATYPNPFNTTANVIVTNNNATPIHTTLYLIDEAGNKVMELFNGEAQIGDTDVRLSAVNVASGRYWLIVENSLGKTYMSVIINK